MPDVLSDSAWFDLLTYGRFSPGVVHPAARSFAAVLRRMPGSPRCQICHGPFEGSGARFASILGIRPSSFSMHLCGRCEHRARTDKTGAHVETATVFADIRGSTRLAEDLGPEAYRDLIDRFYRTATDVLISHRAIIEKLVGDQVAAIFVPGFAGPRWVEHAIDAAQELRAAFEEWVPVGIGVHAGTAFVGIVGTIGGMTELTVLGDVPNLTARLAGVAGAGEVLVSEAALEADGGPSECDVRTLTLKGFDEPVRVGTL